MNNNPSAKEIKRNILKSKLNPSFKETTETLPKDSLAEEREIKWYKYSERSLNRENRRVSDQVRLLGALNDNLWKDEFKAPLNKNSEGFNKKFMRKKTKFNNKQRVKTNTGKQLRSNWKSHVVLGNDINNNQLGKKSGRMKKGLKCNSKKDKRNNNSKSKKNRKLTNIISLIGLDSQSNNFTYETSSRTIDEVGGRNPHLNKYITKDFDKENIGVNEKSSQRYSEMVKKEDIFESKEESISGVNELNLLQELTNFTNMKMMKKKDKHKSQHCIHFNRIIKDKELHF